MSYKRIGISPGIILLAWKLPALEAILKTLTPAAR